MNKILEINDLKKSYKMKKAVKGISFSVYEGEILGFLGPNGAGKSTTINILSTVLKPDSGNIKFEGKNINNDISYVKKNIGIVPQDLAIYENISAEKNVRFFASLYNLKGKELDDSVKHALEFVKLYDKRYDKPKTFSGGMKRRLNIACAIAHNPKLIIMDEPTVGIDPQSRNYILESILNLKKHGTTVIYTTHYMEEVEEIADKIIIMDHGLIIAEGTKEQLQKQVLNEKKYTIYSDNISNLNKSSFFKIEGIKDVCLAEDSVKITSLNMIENLDKIISYMINCGCRIKNISTVLPSLETLFLKLTGKTLRD